MSLATSAVELEFKSEAELAGPKDTVHAKQRANKYVFDDVSTSFRIVCVVPVASAGVCRDSTEHPNSILLELFVVAMYSHALQHLPQPITPSTCCIRASFVHKQPKCKASLLLDTSIVAKQ